MLLKLNNMRYITTIFRNLLWFQTFKKCRAARISDNFGLELINKTVIQKHEKGDRHES